MIDWWLYFIQGTHDEVCIIGDGNRCNRRCYPAGACSFTKVTNQYGLDVTVGDITYDHSVDSLESKGYHDLEHAMESMKKARSNYVWDYFNDIEAYELND
ncbi:hypothetical protein J2Z64_001313 [Oceanobacillus polygoni]|uniref:Uncharacterized protein n=1 Tax=Oceanobacillus polygoni TaxID=1235259 RepID=A0A9X1CG49_9BACI|nr:hypothetical protein [Oceanobacillus polygoni]